MGQMKNLAIQIAEQNISELYRDHNAEMMFIRAMDREQQQRVVYEEQVLEQQIKEDKENE
tara:strand:+ start:78 stop:257 length:180 start_codon:yes stop_codon:yes gene_type:complete